MSATRMVDDILADLSYAPAGDYSQREQWMSDEKPKKKMQKRLSEMFKAWLVPPEPETFSGEFSIPHLGAGDSSYIADVFNPHESRSIMEGILREAEFTQMFHFRREHVRPINRLVVAQTDISYHSPLYRMPGCNERNIPRTSWTSSVNIARRRAEEVISQDLNHCVVTLYRDKNDGLAFHHDKLLDLAPDSLIVSASFGSPRPIWFFEDEQDGSGSIGRRKQVVMLKPGSLLVIGPETNKKWTHCIPKLKNEVGPRISLSLRKIATFDTECGEVVGQGEMYQTQNWPFSHHYPDSRDYSNMIKAEMRAGTKVEEDVATCLTHLEKSAEDDGIKEDRERKTQTE